MTTALAVYDIFQGTQVRKVDRGDGRAWRVFADCCKALGFQGKPSNQLNRIPKQHTYLIGLLAQDGRTRKQWVINEEGLISLIAYSRLPKEQLDAFRELIGQRATVPPSDNALADAINNMTAFLKSIEARVSALEGKPTEVGEAKQTAVAVLPEVQPKTYEAQISQHVRQWVEEKKKNNPRVNYPAVWNQIYYEFKYTYPHDLKRIAINRGISGVKAAALINMLPELLSLVIHLTDRDFNGYFD